MKLNATHALACSALLLTMGCSDSASLGEREAPPDAAASSTSRDGSGGALAGGSGGHSTDARGAQPPWAPGAAETGGAGADREGVSGESGAGTHSGGGTPNEPPRRGPVRILALGDSITEFVKKPVDNCPQGYRYELWKLLIDSGLEFDFVGTHNATAEWPGQDQYVYPTYKGKAFDNDNNAFGGWTSGDLLNGKPSDEWNGWQGKLGDWLAKVTPDAVLLHVGTNDSWSWVEPAVYLRNLSDILDLIQTKHPVAVIYLAKLIPFGSKLAATDGARVPLYNAELDALAASKRGRGKVVVVDQHAGYEPDVDNACDVYAVHPGLSGAQKMARKWRDALLADFPAR